jgi:hypothetical protein
MRKRATASSAREMPIAANRTSDAEHHFRAIVTQEGLVATDVAAFTGVSLTAGSRRQALI